MIFELKRRLGSLNKALEFFYLISDLKPVCRFGFYEKDINSIRKLCADNRLQMVTSNFKVLIDSGKNIGDFSNKGYKTSLQNPFPGMVFAYISKDIRLAELAKYLENANNTKRLGQLLGYPDCCIDFFVENAEEQAKKNNDFVLPALKNSNSFVFPKELNIAARYFDFNVLPFFPHSFSCKNAVKTAKSYFREIAEHDSSLAVELAGKLNCGVIYTEKLGVFLLENPVLKEHYLNFDKAVSTQKGRLLDELNNFKRINILDKNNFIVGPNMLKNVGVMVFE
jgi:hypothetical protein